MFQEESNKDELLNVQKSQFKWLLRWRNWSDRDEEDVRCIFSKLELDFMFNERPAWEIPLAVKLSQVVHQFMWLRELKTDRWKRDEIFELLCFVHVYDLGHLIDAVLNLVTTQHLEPSSFATLYGLARKLESSKLEQVLVDYLRNNTRSLITSAEFTKYPANVVEFLFQNLSGQIMDVKRRSLIYISMKKWRQSNSGKEVEKVFNNIEWQDFLRKLRADLFIRSFKDDFNDGSKDVIFVFENREIKVHKTVLAYSCHSLKQLVDQNKGNRIKMHGTNIEQLNNMVKECYIRMMDFTHWDLSETKQVYEFATKYNYKPLMDLVKTELEKRLKVPISVESLNEAYGNRPDEDIREWVKNNQLRIVNYEDCHKYSGDLVVLIMDTFCELADKGTDKEKLETPMKKLLLWLFRWRNSSIRKEDDVQSLFARIRLPLVFKDRALGNKTLQEKIFVAVRRFCHIREVDTAGWTCDDVLDLLHFAHDYEFGPLVDAVVNVVATEYLEPTALEKIHDLTSRLKCNKLQEIIADYINNQTMIILTSAEFTNYPASVVVFILEKLSGQAMDLKLKNQLLTSLSKWKTSKSEEEVKAVFTNIQWEDFSRKQLARVRHIVNPVTCMADIPGQPAPAKTNGPSVSKATIINVEEVVVDEKNEVPFLDLSSFDRCTNF